LSRATASGFVDMGFPPKQIKQLTETPLAIVAEVASDPGQAVFHPSRIRPVEDQPVEVNAVALGSRHAVDRREPRCNALSRGER